MKRAHFPFLVVPSHAVAAMVGRDLDTVAVLALKAILQHRKGLEVAHQQIRYRRSCFAFSSRVGRYGDLILELDVGDPRLAERLILEADLRQAELQRARERDTRRHR